MIHKLLVDLEFGGVLNSYNAQTQTGSEFLNRYKSYLMEHEENFAVVNSFIKEAANLRYDNSVNSILEHITDYISKNNVSWALATTCEAINNNHSSYNYLNRNACKQVEKLLENDENTVVKYIKAGALKNIMYCESFRNIAKQVYKSQPLVEATADYVKVTPVSFIESDNNTYKFVIEGQVYSIDENKNISKIDYNKTSNTFRLINGTLNSNICTVDEDSIIVIENNTKYCIKEEGVITKTHKENSEELSVEQLRENNNLLLMSTNPNMRVQRGKVLEAIAVIAENYNNIVNLDNAGIYSTKNDKFIVIESNDNIYSELIHSNRHPKWVINEDALSACDFIKSKTNVQLAESYKKQIGSIISKVNEEQAKKIEESLKDEKINSYKERIEALTEKFKNSPAHLAVLSKIAHDINSI